MWQNMMTTDEQAQQERIGIVRKMLQKADLMGCRSVVTTVGTAHPSDNHLAPHAENYSRAFQSRFREVVLRILDGLDLKIARYIIEPWHNNFFYQPEEIREFIDTVGHSCFGLHLDQMNMVDQRSFFNTTDLIIRTFELLTDQIVSVHLKDIRCDYPHMFLKWDEVIIGDGVLDYDTYLKKLNSLPPDTPCYCEHLPDERDYALNIARVKYFAEKAGVEFVMRKAS
jgi:sugar phosphate isomerase/epimerase